MRRSCAAALVLCHVGAAAAPHDYLSRFPERVHERLAALAASRVPKLVPPTPTPVVWKAVRLGSIDVGAPLVALTAADLDSDGTSELYAVTSREVVALALKGKLVELGRVSFVGARAVPAPRDVVGTAAVDNGVLVAASSAFASELRVTLLKGKPVATTGGAGFLVCPGERLVLVPGRNYFAGDLHAVRCKTGLVDRTGAPLALRAQLGLQGKLAVATCVPGGACTTAFEVAHAGTALELADVDRDGVPEVIVSGYVAPGDADTVKVISVGGDERKPKFRRSFNGGVVGIAVAETAVSAPRTVVVAVRLAGSTRVDLWRLD